MLAARVMTHHSLPTVETICDVGAFEGLRPEWEELVMASDRGCVFLTWEWLYTWWKHLAEDRRLFILAVRSGIELIAIAPFCLRPRSLARGRLLPDLEFLGSGFVGSDYLDVIVRSGSDAEACHALASHLADASLSIKWTNVKKNDNVIGRVFARLSQKGWNTAETTTNVCPFIPLTGSTWDSYLSSLSAEHRYNFNRKLRRLNRDYDVRFEQVRTEEECRESIDVLIEQHNTRWIARGGSDAFHTAELVGFHREFTQVALKRGWLRLYVLRLNEKPAANLYGLMYRDTFYFYQSSFDAAHAQNSVGLITMGLAIKNAMGEGADEYDLLHGNESYKSHWSRQSRELVRLEGFCSSGLGRCCRLSVELGRVSRALARQVKSRGQSA